MYLSSTVHNLLFNVLHLTGYLLSTAQLFHMLHHNNSCILMHSTAPINALCSPFLPLDALYNSPLEHAPPPSHLTVFKKKVMAILFIACLLTKTVISGARWLPVIVSQLLYKGFCTLNVTYIFLRFNAKAIL